MGRKLCKEDDRSNLITGLVITVVALGGGLYLYYRVVKQRNKSIAFLNQGIDQLKDQNRRQGEAYSRLEKENSEQQQKIYDLEKYNQSLANQMSEKEKQSPEA